MKENDKIFYYNFTEEENTYLTSMIKMLKEIEKKIPNKFKTSKSIILENISNKMQIK